ncbi:MAG TPA: YHS domain-containing (seleno)protein [Aestuariivirga sp.]|nr:YHS domain-containing (seleno)protein [Aestuariivirga sp.]
MPVSAGTKQRFDQNLAGIAIEGYDTVAYFTEGKAVKGSDTFSYDWLGATWHFASARHRDLFSGEPIKYAPQYGGYCTSGIVVANIHAANPKVWRIIDGKLYLNGSDYALKSWADKGPEGIGSTDAEWVKLEAKLTQ